MTDHRWAEINRLVLAGLEDRDILNHPPQTQQDVENIADTITDHVITAMQ